MKGPVFWFQLSRNWMNKGSGVDPFSLILWLKMLPIFYLYSHSAIILTIQLIQCRRIWISVKTRLNFPSLLFLSLLSLIINWKFVISVIVKNKTSGSLGICNDVRIRVSECNWKETNGSLLQVFVQEDGKEVHQLINQGLCFTLLCSIEFLKETCFDGWRCI